MIDWGPSSELGLHGKYPDFPDDAVIGEEARKLKADAEAMLDRMEAENAVRCQAVFGWPATARETTSNSQGRNLAFPSPAEP